MLHPLAELPLFDTELTVEKRTRSDARSIPCQENSQTDQEILSGRGENHKARSTPLDLDAHACSCICNHWVLMADWGCITVTVPSGNLHVCMCMYFWAHTDNIVTVLSCMYEQKDTYTYRHHTDMSVSDTYMS